MRNLEKRFEVKIRNQLKKIRNCWVLPKTMSISVRGVPDILAVCNGTFIAMEVKKDLQSTRIRTKTTMLQNYNLSEIDRCGGMACFVCPENIDDVMNVIMLLSARERCR